VWDHPARNKNTHILRRRRVIFMCTKASITIMELWVKMKEERARAIAVLFLPIELVISSTAI
jgi:hypothetical protein